MKILITGATSGIGAALAKLVTAEGHEVIGVGRSAGATVQADLATPEGRDAVVAVIRKELPHVVVNAAGFGLYGAAVDLDTLAQLKVFEVDVKAVYQLTVEAAKAWREAGRHGTVLNVSSAAAFFVFPLFAVYAGAKACVNSFSQALDEELRSQSIRVLTACPGMVKTNFQSRASEGRYQISGFGVMEADEAARHIWKQIQRKNNLSVFHWPYRLALFFRHFLPKSFLSKKLRDNIESRL